MVRKVQVTQVSSPGQPILFGGAIFSDAQSASYRIFSDQRQASGSTTGILLCFPGNGGYIITFQSPAAGLIQKDRDDLWP
jgi:hypothetical protein